MISTNQVMKAITYSEYGSPEVLRVEDVPRPVCGDDEVLVRVRAAEATKADCELRRFRFAVNWFWLPLRLALGVRRPRQPVLGDPTIHAELSRLKATGRLIGLTLSGPGQRVVLEQTLTVMARCHPAR